MSEEVLVGVIEFNEAKRIQAALSEKGIRVRLAGNPDACKTKGCKITLEMHAKTDDLPAIGEYFKEERLKSLEGLDYNLELHNEVFDPEQDNARCPACGTQFSTKMRECPECGLVFVIDEGQ